jgi:hypothetical protein
MAIKREDVMKKRNKEFSLSEAIDLAAVEAMKENEYNRAITLYCLTHNLMSDKEKEEAIDELGELYVNNFCKKIISWAEESAIKDEFIKRMPEVRDELKQTHIASLKAQFKEWDNLD